MGVVEQVLCCDGDGTPWNETENVIVDYCLVAGRLVAAVVRLVVHTTHGRVLVAPHALEVEIFAAGPT